MQHTYVRLHFLWPCQDCRICYAMWGLIGMGVQLAVIVFLQTTIVARLRRTVAEAV